MRRRPTNVIGQRFGRLVVTAEAEPIIRSYPGREVHKSRRVVCRCDCGREDVFELGHLRQGRSRSCGCLRAEMLRARALRHGESHNNRTTEYITWKGMKRRCENPQDKSYYLYGGRGIKVCERWQTFENFLADMGRRPSPKHSIDRYPDNNGDYEPGNCRWATAKEQRANQRPRSEWRQTERRAAP